MCHPNTNDMIISVLMVDIVYLLSGCTWPVATHQTPVGGTLPLYVAVTTLKPDIVIADRKCANHIQDTYQKKKKTRLVFLHKFCKKSIKLRKFVNNNLVIRLLGSYHISNSRSHVLWPEMPPIEAHLPNQ